MKKRLSMGKFALLVCCAALCAFLCAACSSSSVKGYTARYDTPENLARFQASPLFTLAEGFYRSAKNDSSAASAYPIAKTKHPTTPQEPFLAVAVRLDENSQPAWNVCGGSFESMDLDSVRTLALCIISKQGANYRGSGLGTDMTFHGTTESARVLYLDVPTASYIQEKNIAAKKLPEHATNVPHYTLSNSTLISQVQKDLALPFTLSAEGEITGGTLEKDLDGYQLPDSVKKIAKLSIDDEITSLSLPPSVEEIAPGIIRKQTKVATRHADPQPVVLTVTPGSYGETFAREGGYVYKRPDDSQEYLWVAGCECTFDRNRLYGAYPIAPDGDLAEIMQCGILLFVEEGSPAAAYAQAHQYLYSYTDKWEYRFCVNGLEWLEYNNKPGKNSSRRVICVPDGVSAEDDTLKWAIRKNHYKYALVPPGSGLEETVRDAGVECWTGTADAAERAWTDEKGLSWRIVYSFRDGDVLAVHIPADYTQERRNPMDIWQLCRDIGFGSGGSYPSVYPLCYVQMGTWAAENARVWIEEGSTVLHMSYSGNDYNGSYITDYACGVVTQVIDPYFNAFNYGVPQRTLSSRGVKALYTKSPLGHNPVNPFCLTDDPGKMYYWAPDDQDWHLDNGKVLQDVHTLKIHGDMTDAAELSWVLFRAGQEAPFLLQIEAGTAIEAFARENGIPYEIWDRQQTPFIESDERP